MSSVNIVVLAGNLTRDPEVRTVGANNTSVCSMGLAVDDSYTKKGGDRVESTVFVEIECWGKTAENCGEYLKKGSSILVDGRLNYQSWENDEGQKRSKLLVKANRVEFLGKKNEERVDKDSDDVPF